MCDATGPITREHVPPKNLFLAPRPRNTLTVPVCGKCNHSYHLDDEYFRIYVTTGAQPGTRLGRLWTEKVVGSSFARSEALLCRLKNDHVKLLEHHKTDPIKAFDGAVLPDEQLPLVQPFTASRISAVVEKIVRCLHFVQSGNVLSPVAKCDVSVAPLSDEEHRSLYDERSGEVGHHDEFVFRVDSIGEGSTQWLLGFYRFHTFTVRVSAR